MYSKTKHRCIFKYFYLEKNPFAFKIAQNTQEMLITPAFTPLKFIHPESLKNGAHLQHKGPKRNKVAEVQRESKWWRLLPPFFFKWPLIILRCFIRTFYTALNGPFLSPDMDVLMFPGDTKNTNQQQKREVRWKAKLTDTAPIKFAKPRLNLCSFKKAKQQLEEVLIIFTN